MWNEEFFPRDWGKPRNNLSKDNHCSSRYLNPASPKYKDTATCRFADSCEHSNLRSGPGRSVTESLLYSQKGPCSLELVKLYDVMVTGKGEAVPAIN